MESAMFWSFPPPTMSKTPQNMTESYYHPLAYWLLEATIGNQGSPMINLQCSEVFPHRQWAKTSQNMPKTSNLLLWLAAIFNNSRWLPYRRPNMAANLWNFRVSWCLVQFPPCMLPCMLITVYDSCTWLMCVRTVPSTFQKKWPKNRPSTT